MTKLEEQNDHVWVFNGAGARFPSGVFRTREEAEVIITTSRLVGTLTKYPVGMFVIDWAVDRGCFSVDSAHELELRRQTFSSAYLEHYHYDDEEQQVSLSVTGLATRLVSTNQRKYNAQKTKDSTQRYSRGPEVQ